MSHRPSVLDLRGMTHRALVGEVAWGLRVGAWKVARKVLSPPYEDLRGPGELLEMSNIRTKD